MNNPTLPSCDLQKKYDYLTLNPKCDERISKKNLLAVLKKELPNVKFSVRNIDYMCYSVTYTDSVTSDKVKDVCSLFEVKQTRRPDDYIEEECTNFTILFGSLTVFVERIISPAIFDAELEQVKADYPGIESYETISDDDLFQKFHVLPSDFKLISRCMSARTLAYRRACSKNY